jgi:mono/diheme cytochrome c family protein
MDRLDKGDQAMNATLRLVVLGVLWLGVWQQEKKPGEEKAGAEKTSGEANKLVNPVKATPESIARGRKAYGFDCAMCHGKEGAGDGDLAESMHLKLKDYRDPAALKDMTDGEMYAIIMNGKGQMAGEEGRLKPEQVWNVVNYVRSLAKK